MTEPCRPRESTIPKPIRSSSEASQPPRAFGPKRVRDQLLRERRRVHGIVILAEHKPPLEDVLHLLVEAVLGQDAVALARRVALHRARHRDHDADAEGSEFKAQRTRIGANGGLAGAVDRPKQVRCDGRERRDIDDQAPGGDELVDERLDHGHDGEDICLKRRANIRE